MMIVNPSPDQPKSKLPKWLWVGLAGWAVMAMVFVSIPERTGSPDEAANAFFIQRLSNQQSLVYETALSAAQANFWHPRSMVVDQTTLKPGSFLGSVLVGGWLNRVMNFPLDKYLTPLVATLALLALFHILRRFWNEQWSGLGVALVAVHPVWVQFQTLPYFHNGAFAALLVIAGWRMMRLWDDGQWRNALWFGVAYGGALFIRPVEALWTAPLVAIVLLAQRKWLPLLIAVGMTLIVQLPWLLVNQQVYGSWLGGGYAPSGTTELLGSTAESAFGSPRILTPPGGWSWNWIHSFWNYLVLLVPAWSVATGLALWYYLRRIRTQPLKLVKISLVSLVLVWLVVYYGSWNLYPLEIPSAVGSLASYTRYWIPLYVVMMVGVLWTLKRIQVKKFIILAVTAMVVSQVTTIVWHPNSGLLHRFEQDRTLAEKRDFVLAATPPTAAIVAGQMDKVLFPERVVSFRWPESAADWMAIQTLSAARSIYVYVTPRQYDLRRMNAELQPYGFQVGSRLMIQSDQLWEIVPL